MNAIQYRRDLYKLFPDVSNTVCAEVGVAEGQFAYDILSWGIKYLYAIDLWESHPELSGDIANSQAWHDKNYVATVGRLVQYPGRFEILRGPSIGMAQLINQPLDFVNIDCCHTYQCVKNDIAAYYPKLKSGGIIAFHDYEMKQYGVKQAVTEFAKANGLYIHLLPEDKDEDAGAFFFKP